jgi:hypothetical protein
MTRNRFAWPLLALCSPALVACGKTDEPDPVSAQNLALTAQQNVERALRGAHDAGSFVAESGALAKLLSTGSESDCPPVATCPPGGTCVPETPDPCETEDAVQTEDLAEAREDLREAIDDLVKTLREKIFTDANLESADSRSATYLLRPNVLCDSEESVADAAPPPAGGATLPPPEPEVDTECIEQAQRLQPRLRLTSPREGDVDVALLLGAQKRNPITLEFGSTRVGVAVDLGELKGTLDSLGEEVEGLAAMDGKLGLELVRNAALDYSVRLNVLEQLALSLVDDDNQRIAVSLAPSKPTVELRFDGNTRKVSGAYAYGAFGLSGPLNAFREFFDEEDEGVDVPADPVPRKNYTGDIALSIPGYDGKVVLDGSQDRLNLTGLGLGDAASTLKFNGTTIASVDINPTTGRHFDLAIEQSEQNGEQRTKLGFAPGLDLTVLLNLMPLANQITDIPDYALGDTLRVKFDGATPSLQAEEDQLRVLSGMLSVTSTRVPSANLNVPAGSCLFDSNLEAPAHALLGELAAGACK